MWAVSSPHRQITAVTTTLVITTVVTTIINAQVRTDDIHTGYRAVAHHTDQFNAGRTADDIATIESRDTAITRGGIIMGTVVN